MTMQAPIAFLMLCRWYEIPYLCTDLVASVVSAVLILISAALLVLFPAVDLPPIEGTYNVGVVDVFLPVQLEGEEEADVLKREYNIDYQNMATHITTRIFYPTDEKVSSGIPYVNKTICAALMNVTNPPTSPMSHMGFLIHSWCLVRLPVVRNAKPASAASSKTTKKFPLAFYSHGLTGNSFSYSYQAASLAAQGYVVMLVEHRDGSAAMTVKEDGRVVEFDRAPAKMWVENRIEHDRYRRKQTVFRATEMIAASRALIKLNDTNPDVLSQLGIDFCTRLDTECGILACGHSFGGATALSFAVRVPEFCAGVVAHEPASDWICDKGRRALFQADPTYTGGVTLGFEDNCNIDDNQKEDKESSSSKSASKMGIHDLNLLFLFSEEWMKNGTGECNRIQKLYMDGHLGPIDGVSNFKFFEKSTHSTFSDCCMLTPTWIARATGLTGPGDPHDHADLIRRNTHRFIEEVEQRR
eukprot:CAMPEP_0196806900 /NCGR_PEP_ID=MMETSP1362-20130617/6834_1 /TAXON_ID=163516 /ORGANISM="Leptocylindrus danicus, Strain CCMP1856" /LENGTH=469 /DNA_ID=CAMNT_0042180585 /DNA_START=107 /DNA_END=1516 /DNA_ORIENTATION=-